MVLMPAAVPAPARERVEAELARYAGEFDPRRLRLLAARMLDVLDPDNPSPSRTPARLTPPGGSCGYGSAVTDVWRWRAGWTPSTAVWCALIERLATHQSAGDGQTDARTVPERHADALIELCERARAAEDFPTTAGQPPHVTVTIDWNALRTGLGNATLDYGQRLSVATARRLSCDCKVIPAVLSDAKSAIC